MKVRNGEYFTDLEWKCFSVDRVFRSFRVVAAPMEVQVIEGKGAWQSASADANSRIGRHFHDH